MPELLPCPFCGETAEIIEDFYVEGFMQAVACTHCDAATVHVGVVNTFEMNKTLTSLVTQWNTRVSKES